MERYRHTTVTLYGAILVICGIYCTCRAKRKNNYIQDQTNEWHSVTVHYEDRLLTPDTMINTILLQTNH